MSDFADKLREAIRIGAQKGQEAIDAVTHTPSVASGDPSIRILQTNLAHAGHDPGPLDGFPGPKTYQALLDYAARRIVAPGLADALARHLPASAINTRLRITHFLAQALHETGGFRYLVELGGPKYFTRYDGRRDLGNVHPGDGYRFRGRGIFQLTGRTNYEDMGPRLGLDLIGEPDLAAEPNTATRIACLYWTGRHLNPLADADDILTITRKINGGTNGLADRQAYLARIKAVWPS